MKTLNFTLAVCMLLFSILAFAQPGSLDSTFNKDGTVRTKIGTGLSLGYAVAIQTDKKDCCGRSYFTGK